MKNKKLAMFLLVFVFIGLAYSHQALKIDQEETKGYNCYQKLFETICIKSLPMNEIPSNFSEHMEGMP